MVPLQVYVLWLHLIFNIALPLAVLVTLNKAIYDKLSQVRVSKSINGKSVN